MPQRIGVFHHAAAELDDRDLVAELADPAKGFDQDVGFFDRMLVMLGDGHVVGNYESGVRRQGSGVSERAATVRERVNAWAVIG